MSIFYGVYIEDEELSAALDLIRYLGEPDALRFAHITLRGPYERDLPPSTVESLNRSIGDNRSVFLSGPGSFFSAHQSTVILRVELNNLQSLVKKPDFQDSIAHVTLYDGREKLFASQLLNMLQEYDFYKQVNVSKLRKIDKKAPLAGAFHEIYPSFRHTMTAILGNYCMPQDIGLLPGESRLFLIRRTLDYFFQSHFSKLVPRTPSRFNLNLDFGFPETVRKMHKSI